MEKEQAENYIRKELSKDRSQEQIVAALCQELGAPPEIVRNFVSKVANEAPALPSDPVPTTPLMDFSTPKPDPSKFPEQDELERPQVSYAPDPGPAIGYSTTPLEHPAPPLVQEIPEIETASPIPEDVLEAEILKALGKNRKQSDVVVLVCEKTGMNWAQAQRMVAGVATKHHKKLTTRRNWLTFPLSITGIIVGGALVAAAIAEDYEAARQINELIQGNSSYVGDLEFVIRESLWALATGSLLFIGGVAGLVIGLKKQFS